MADVDLADEVSKRSADGSDGTTFKKTFLVKGAGYEAADHPIHDANKAGVAQEALNRGLHPKDVASLLSAEVVSHDRRGVPSMELTYGVECVPASVDEAAEETVAPAQVVKKTRARKTVAE